MTHTCGRMICGVICHDDVIKSKLCTRYWSFVWEFTGHLWILFTKASDAELFFGLYLNKWLSNQSRSWWFEMQSCSLWHSCNVSSNSSLSFTSIHAVLYAHMYSISQEICTRFCCALLCCGYAIVHNELTWSIYPYSSGLFCWHWGNR